MVKNSNFGGNVQYRSIFRPELMAGQRVLVTGGGSGIGRCVVHELLALGAEVAILGRNAEKLQRVSDECKNIGKTVHSYVCDIRQEDAVVHTISQIVDQIGGIDALVNNAGGQFPALLKDISLKGWQAVVETNLSGGFLMARECLKQSMQEHGGAIVNIVADMWGSMPMMGHSGAARAGMVSFTETAALEWAQYGVRVNAVAPGYIASSGMDAYPPAMAPVLRAAASGVPLQRMGNEAEVSAAIVFLLSPAASFITGSVLRVDGGRPQMRVGFGVQSSDIPDRPAVRAFDGFPLAVTPKLLRDDPEP